MRRAALWSGIVISPLAWFANLQISFMLASRTCEGRLPVSLYVVTAVSLLLAASAGFVSWTQAREVPPSPQRAVALGGVLLSAFLVLVILAQAIPHLMRLGCQ
jgi:hypothetical protein